jgi:hypothetical protein
MSRSMQQCMLVVLLATVLLLVQPASGRSLQQVCFNTSFLFSRLGDRCRRGRKLTLTPSQGCPVKLQWLLVNDPQVRARSLCHQKHYGNSSLGVPALHGQLSARGHS